LSVQDHLHSSHIYTCIIRLAAASNGPNAFPALEGATRKFALTLCGYPEVCPNSLWLPGSCPSSPLLPGSYPNSLWLPGSYANSLWLPGSGSSPQGAAHSCPRTPPTRSLADRPLTGLPGSRLTLCSYPEVCPNSLWLPGSGSSPPGAARTPALAPRQPGPSPTGP
jgi:hypothetical protein